MLRALQSDSLTNWWDNSHICTLYKKVGFEKMHAYAGAKKVMPFVAHLMCSLDLDSKKWQPIHAQYQARNEAIIQVLINVFCALELVDVRHIVLYENFGAVLSANDCIGCFASGDVDLLASVQHKDTINTVLLKQVFYRRNASKCMNTVESEYYSEGNGFGINVMWQPLARIRLPFQTCMETYLNWDDCGYYLDTKLRIPRLETLVFLCLLHVSVHSFIRLPAERLYRDIVILSNCNPVWSEVYSFARKDMQIRRVTVALYVTEYLFKRNIFHGNIGEIFTIGWREKLIIWLVLDKGHNKLSVSHGYIKVLIIEILVSDISIAGAIRRLIYPGSKWLRTMHSNNVCKAYFGYLRNLIWL